MPKEQALASGASSSSGAETDERLLEFIEQIVRTTISLLSPEPPDGEPRPTPLLTPVILRPLDFNMVLRAPPDPGAGRLVSIFLKPVQTKKGTLVDVPAFHEDCPIEDSSPAAIGRLALQWHEEMVGLADPLTEGPGFESRRRHHFHHRLCRFPSKRRLFASTPPARPQGGVRGWTLTTSGVNTVD